MRALCVAAFAVSGYASTEGRTCKPFNPVLGETYEADFPDKGIRFFSEKVSFILLIIVVILRIFYHLSIFQQRSNIICIFIKITGEPPPNDCSMPL